LNSLAGWNFQDLIVSVHCVEFETCLAKGKKEEYMWPYPKIKIINSCFRSNVINASKKIFSQSSCLKPLICNCLAISEDEVVVQPL